MNPVINVDILAPAAVLATWSVFILIWVMITRFPAFKSQGIDLTVAPPGGRYADVEGSMPPRVNWVAHNHNHLMEQPTVFYGVIAVLALAGAGESAVLWAWAYTGLRILHSLWQILVNTIPVRFLLFISSAGCLGVLSVEAVRLTLLR